MRMRRSSFLISGTLSIFRSCILANQRTTKGRSRGSWPSDLYMLLPPKQKWKGSISIEVKETMSVLVASCYSLSVYLVSHDSEHFILGHCLSRGGRAVARFLSIAIQQFQIGTLHSLAYSLPGLTNRHLNILTPFLLYTSLYRTFFLSSLQLHPFPYLSFFLSSLQLLLFTYN